MSPRTTKEQAHTATPGPWEVHKYPSVKGGHGFTIRCKASKGITIANLSPGSSTDRIEPIAEANARLIAAAPELLDACDFALSILEALGNGSGDAANACRAAIAKAEGRS